MKLTNRELIRLKKEVFLMEHGFYNTDIDIFFAIIQSEKDKQLEILNKYADLNYYKPKDLEKIWFRETFPEFFEKEIEHERN
jgi:hypothetical protein